MNATAFASALPADDGEPVFPAAAEDDTQDPLAEAFCDAKDEDTALAAPSSPAASATDEQLAAWIARIGERDERALAALYDATLPRVYGLVLRIVRRPGLAEEVVEDAYFQVWRQALRFDPARGRALTWLLNMARTRAIDAVRSEARHRHESLDAACMPELADELPWAAELLEAARGHRALEHALLRLGAQPRQLVALAFLRGLSHEEIASHTALPLGTVKSQIRRGLITLRQLLTDGTGPALAS
jgi:RNA polymerase sigma-70 factor (ECF subfamily)